MVPFEMLTTKKLVQNVSTVTDAGVSYAERKAAFITNPCGQQLFIKVYTTAPPFLFIEGLFFPARVSLSGLLCAAGRLMSVCMQPPSNLAFRRYSCSPAECGSKISIMPTNRE